MSVVLEMTQFQTIVSGFIQHIEGISTEVEKEKLTVNKLCKCCMLMLEMVSLLDS